jgi:hypothetical protein
MHVFLKSSVHEDIQKSDIQAAGYDVWCIVITVDVYTCLFTKTMRGAIHTMIQET